MRGVAVMVDKERRDAIKKLGIGGLLLGGGGVGAAQVHGWVTDLDNDIDAGEMETEIGAEIKGREWSADILVIGVETELEHTGTTEKGGDVYTATVTAPLRTDTGYKICDHTEERQELQLADTLLEEAETLFGGMYDAAGKYAEPRRRPEEDRITAYTLQFEDETGIAAATISADEAHYVAQKEPKYNANWDDTRNRFIHAYSEAFDARCHSDGG